MIDKLLRLRKDLPTAPCEIAQAYWEKYIRPLFEQDEIVNQSLVAVDTGLITQLSTQLREGEVNGKLDGLNRSRLKKRHGTYLAYDTHGLLVTDMTPGLCSVFLAWILWVLITEVFSGQYFVEFKPKWLVQSPSAPADSKRCRTCALAARTKANARPGETLKSPVCPLDLISADISDVERAAGLFPATTQVNKERLIRWLRSTRLLQRLRDIQDKMDSKGVLDADTDDPNLLVAMTLRDCTVFVRFPDDPSNDDSAVEARLGDLDLKGKGKEEYWKSLERALIEEGWYEGKEKAEDAQPLTCSIGRVKKK